MAILLVIPIDKPLASSGEAPLLIKQGDVIFLLVRSEKGALSVEGKYRNRTIPFYPMADSGEFGAIIGADLADPPSLENLIVKGLNATGGVEEWKFPIEILPRQFETQNLTLPEDFVDLDKKTAIRVKEEQERILKSINGISPVKLWAGEFIVPVEGKIKGSFGRKRVINGQPRSPHTGEDITAPLGAKVRATNQGVITLVGDFFFSGKSIFLDHGLGLHSMYFHLDEIHVKKGETVQKGDIIGKVGSTGRATGPHLHWGTRLNGARVNPFSVMKVR